ncbi:hypothetical protein BX616_006000 [Lobosporangium transversale]|uniref:Uncharacterized protein n=1 Tax=Lobosporangium transversale TaxID=64571 RepID=A0A1Y2GIG6_9FUNG|nr:hypothetical protein BCR41DRAFT_359296 [Lobosporangium transversale]KAF9915521.1 hypothetical protein BX616_006000 [Lobosporangium transversale]ORZ08492.1 hypothetical protein BCR41DRAFT_359296 [Lobosporangium transversale]|eukprot:XP_021878420.1 hypothetical protein BCR41DRAFT_359296 [Lobosporangium transversale]
MSSTRNRNHLHATMPLARVHCVRVRQMMGRKHQLWRRGHYSSSHEHFSTSDNQDMNHQAKINMDEASFSSSSWMSTSSSMTRHIDSSRSGFCSVATKGSLHRRRRNNFGSSGQYDKDDIDCSQVITASPMGTASSGSINDYTYSSYQQYGEDTFSGNGNIMSPILPVAISPIDVDSNIVSSFTPLCSTYEMMEDTRYSLSSRLFSHTGARTHSSSGAGSGAGGGSDGSGSAPADMNPGEGDAGNGDQPSDYTFRRRNAIVEGSEDAPKAEDFTSSSPK